MRELMLESARREQNPGPSAPVTIWSDKDLHIPGRLLPCPSRGGKCKDRAHRWGGSDQAELATNLLESGEGLIEVFTGVGCRDLAADPGLTLRYYRIAKAGDENAFSQ